MKKEILKQFNQLEEFVSDEVTQIAVKLLNEHDTLEDAINTLNDYYESRYGLDDYVYNEMFKKMKRMTTK